ncbi:MAG: hypothetical protein WC325_06465 [Candidatus Bathyarchaeia archaeon]|jgi:hypothetical protein
MDKNNTMDIRLFFHTILFAYQKKMKQILGTGESVFIHPILNTINLVSEKEGLKLIDGKNLDEVFTNFSKRLNETGMVDNAEFERIDDEKYILYIDGCVFAEHSHTLLEPKDAACPYALLAMSIFQSVTGKKVKIAETTFNDTGGKTVIEAMTP